MHEYIPKRIVRLFARVNTHTQTHHHIRSHFIKILFLFHHSSILSSHLLLLDVFKCFVTGFFFSFVVSFLNLYVMRVTFISCDQREEKKANSEQHQSRIYEVRYVYHIPHISYSMCFFLFLMEKIYLISKVLFLYVVPVHNHTYYSDLIFIHRYILKLYINICCVFNQQ